MLDYRKVKSYIERENDVTLSFTQVQLLKAIIRGDVIYTARGMGRSFLYEAYADYLVNVVGKDTDRTLAQDEFDSIFTADMLRKDDMFKGKSFENVLNRCREASEDRFNREFMCIFNVTK